MVTEWHRGHHRDSAVSTLIPAALGGMHGVRSMHCKQLHNKTKRRIAVEE